MKPHEALIISLKIETFDCGSVGLAVPDALSGKTVAIILETDYNTLVDHSELLDRWALRDFGITYTDLQQREAAVDRGESITMDDAMKILRATVNERAADTTEQRVNRLVQVARDTLNRAYELSKAGSTSGPDRVCILDAIAELESGFDHLAVT